VSVAGDVRLTIQDSGRLRILQDARFQVTIGIHEPEGSVTHGEGPLTVAQVAEANEFGVGKIPARAWIRKWADQRGTQVVNRLREAILTMVRAQHFMDHSGIDAVAAEARDDLAAQITDGKITPPNAQATLRRKAPETRPLFDTGQMVEAAQAEVRAQAPLNWDFSTRGRP
jgi:hypothetical protein